MTISRVIKKAKFFSSFSFSFFFFFSSSSSSSFSVSFLFLLSAVKALKCYECLETSWEGCNTTQKVKDCPSLFTHCFTATGNYQNGSQTLVGMARDCIMCHSQESACTLLKTTLKMKLNMVLETCHIDCCQGDMCNAGDINVTPTSSKTTSMYPTSVHGNGTKGVISSSPMVAAVSRGVVVLLCFVVFTLQC